MNQNQRLLEATLINNTLSQNLPPPIQPPLVLQTTSPSKLSRRHLTLTTPTLSLILSATSAIVINPLLPSHSRAEPETTCTTETPTKRVFLDVSIDGAPAGRIIIGLFGTDTPVGATRFANLVSGAAGISYRRKEFVKVMPSYVQHGGVRSYGVDAEVAKRSGGRDLAAESLVGEWEKERERCSGKTRCVHGAVGIVVRDPIKPPPKKKLVARGGKLMVDEEEVRSDPNGTEFVLVTKDSPELDDSTLVVGRVEEGMEVVERIAKVKTVQENTSSPYFRVAKLIGDTRAVVAERGFNRPYSKVIVNNCGLIE